MSLFVFIPFDFSKRPLSKKKKLAFSGFFNQLVVCSTRRTCEPGAVAQDIHIIDKS